jgi:hypothetical protein
MRLANVGGGLGCRTNPLRGRGVDGGDRVEAPTPQL